MGQARQPGVSSPERLELAARGLIHRDCFVRREALEALTALAPRGLRSRLVASLSDRCWQVRVAAIEGLQTEAGRRRFRAPPQLVAALADKSMLVRVQAAEALEDFGARGSVPALRRALTDTRPLVRRYVAQALGRLGGANERRLLEEVLAHERQDCARLGMWHALYLLGVDGALTSLLRFLDSDDHTVRSAAAYALEDSRGPGDRRRSLIALRRARRVEKTAAKEAMAWTMRVLQRKGASTR
jgi:HEAT repeat protein